MPRRILLLLAIVVCQPLLCGEAKPRSPRKPKTMEEATAWIRAALPAAAPATPKQPRVLLVYSRTCGFRHDSIAVGIKAMELLGTETKAFTIVASEDPEVISDESLRRFDGVVMLNTTGDAFGAAKGQPVDPKEEARKESFKRFIESGKGLIGIHAATDTYHRWPWYSEAVGGTFAGHPWNTAVPMRCDDPAHPCMAGLGAEGKDLVFNDEIYQYKNQPLARMRVLLRIDDTWPDAAKGKSPDRHVPVSWVKTAGKGRVFYSNLGHNQATYCDARVLAHYLAGIQFAIGDLEGSTEPNPPASAGPAKTAP